MRRTAALTVCLLLVLSGCNALPGAGGSGGAATTAETPAESTTSETLRTDADLPPGVSESGVTDAAALAAAHEEALAGQSYTYDREVRIVADNGTELGRWSQHTQVGADRLRFNHTQTGAGVSVGGVEISDSRIYTNGSVTFANASALPRGYSRQAGRGFAETTFNSEQLLADALDASETSVAVVEREGQTWFRIRATGGTETLTYRAENGTAELNATNVTATAVVSSEGFVRNLTYEYDFERDGASAHREMTVEYSAVGETEVAVPAWVAEAKAATNRNETKRALDDQLAPGLNESGAFDAAKLADAHEAVLRNTSYTVTSNLTARAPNGSLRARSNATHSVVHDPTRAYARSEVRGESPRVVGLAGYDVEVWATENGTWYALDHPNGTEYQKVGNERRAPAAERTHRDAIFVLLSVLNTTVEGTESRNGTALYRVESTGVRMPEIIASHFRADSVENVSLTALVSERGVVREYRVEYTATLGTNTSRVEQTVRFTALGETGVERPAWVADAKASTNETANSTGED